MVKIDHQSLPARAEGFERIDRPASRPGRSHRGRLGGSVASRRLPPRAPVLHLHRHDYMMLHQSLRLPIIDQSGPKGMEKANDEGPLGVPTDRMLFRAGTMCHIARRVRQEPDASSGQHLSPEEVL